MSTLKCGNLAVLLLGVAISTNRFPTSATKSVFLAHVRKFHSCFDINYRYDVMKAPRKLFLKRVIYSDFKNKSHRLSKHNLKLYRIGRQSEWVSNGTFARLS